MAGMNTTRGVPFSPSAAGEQRETARMIQRELDRQEREEAKQRRKEELRAHGRMLDEQARKARRAKRRAERHEQEKQVEQCYREREKS